jgi:hypothetical protein
MIYIIRTWHGRIPPLDIKMVRQTPAILPDSAGQVDFFCLGDPDAAKTAGWPVIPVHDGWYADDRTGGMAIWGQGLFWEVRATPFTISQACGPEAWPPKRQHDQAAATPGTAAHDTAAHDTAAHDTGANIRQAIFQG